MVNFNEFIQVCQLEQKVFQTNDLNQERTESYIYAHGHEVETFNV